MAQHAAISDKAHALIKFLGFSGVVLVLGMAISLGRTQAVIEADSANLKEDQKQTQEVIEAVKVQQQEITDVDRRVTRLEDYKNAH